MTSATASARYVTADFKTAPLTALADLMGLKNYQNQITADPHLFAPILNGIAVYRHLPGPQRSEVLRSIRYDVPRGLISDKLTGLVTGQIVQPFWYMWSLSDEELMEFFRFSQNTASITNQVNPLSLPDFTVGTVATSVLLMSQKGPRAAAQRQIDSLKESELVKAVAKRLGLPNGWVSTLGILSIPTLIVISGVNIMAKKQSEQARRELAARGLLVYRDL